MTTAPRPTVTLRSAGAVVDRVAIGETVDALLVRPADHLDRQVPMPGILWLHWLGHNRGSMRQFLPEAVDLANDGVVSLLPQGHFPWLDDPAGGAGDPDRVREQLGRFGQALSALRGLPGVDADNTAIVGHDYGAMYGLLLRDPVARLVIAAAPDAGWGPWFLQHWPTGVTDTEGYARSFDGLSPLEAGASYGPRLFLQWASRDEYVAGDVAARYAEVSPAARTTTYDYDHQLGDAATQDRSAALRACLLADVVGTPERSGSREV